MQLASRRVEFLQAEPGLVALSPGGGGLAFFADTKRTATAMRAFSAPDAARYPEFVAALQNLGAFVNTLLEATPPPITGGSPADAWSLLKTGRRFRALGRTDGFRLLRWAPMAVADLVAEWFETDLVRAAIAARGIVGTAQGPWSAGTGAVFLMNAAVDPVPGGSSVTVRGGPGALTRAMAEAAIEAGAEIRTGAEVARTLVRDGRAIGVVLSDGTELLARAVVSNADPRRTLLGLVDPDDLEPGFRQKMSNFRCLGTAAKVNLALSQLPAFEGLSPENLHGRLHVGPGIDYLERAADAAKYGRISPEPYLDVTIPSLGDPSLAPPGAHVMSIYVQYAPYRLAAGLDWQDERRTLEDIVVRTLARYAPRIGEAIVARQVITPLDLERTFGFSGGHPLHGEPALDQLFTMRPILGWAQYRTPIAGLYLCGSGTHPGGGVTGGPGQNAAREILRDFRRRS
jgi:phytoene dehydrogenase-like protein